MNKWLRIVGIVGAVGVIGLGILWIRSDAILEAGLEQGIGQATGVKTEIEDVDLRLFSGELTLKGVTLSNPQDFSTPHLLRVKQLDLQIKLGTLSQRPVRVPRLALEGIDLNVEQNSTRNNLLIVIDNLGKPLLERKQSAVGKGILVNIERLSIQDIDATFKINAFGLIDVSKTLEVSDINLSDVDSEDSDGKLEAALVAAVINAIFSEIGDDITGIEKGPQDSLLDKIPLDKIPTDLFPF